EISTVEPVDGERQAVGQQADVEAVLPRAHVDALLDFGEQIEEQGPQPVLLQAARDLLVARAVAAAAAAVREHDDRSVRRRQDEVAVQHAARDGELDGGRWSHGVTPWRWRDLARGDRAPRRRWSGRS